MRTRILMIASLMMLLICAAVIMNACRKNKNQVAVHGQVVDPNSKINVAGATVVLSASIIQDGVYSAGYSEIARTATDGDGFFTFSFKEEIVAGYRIYIDKDGYFSYTKDISANDMPAGQTYEPVYQVYPVGYIKLKVVNVAPFDSTDYISYSFTSGSISCYECCDNTEHYGIGKFVNDSLKCKTYGNSEVSVNWNVIKNNQTTIHNGSIYCKAFDTVSYQINY